ncbi:MAG: TolC family protein [Verrucomicrobia bacterium]|nr:TolC family protein [Verrucomicrobiota bacterium]
MKMNATQILAAIPALAIALLTVACVQYNPRPLSGVATSASFAERSLDNSGLRGFLTTQRAGDSWSVDKLALVAAFFHGDVAVARAEADAAVAGITTAGQRPNPVLSFSPGYNTSSKGISPWIITPSFDVPIETAGKRLIRLDQARAEAEAAQLKVAAAAWEARTTVRDAMLKRYGGNEMAVLLKEEIALHQDAVANLDALVKMGEAPAFEVTQLRLSLNRAELVLHDAEKQAATSLARLASAVGVPVAALSAVTLDFSVFGSLPAVPGTAARRTALLHRSDLLAALADYKAADHALRLEVAKQYPDVRLSPGYEFDQDENKWSIGLSLELPILNQNRGQILQAEAKRTASAARFQAKQAAVFGEIEVALAAYRAAQTKVATADRLAMDGSRASEKTEAMVAAGELGQPDLLRRRIEASAARLSLLQARIEAQEALGQLEAALQLPLSNP